MMIRCMVELKNDPLSQIQLMHMLYRRRYGIVRLLFEQSDGLRCAMVLENTNASLLLRRLEALPCVNEVILHENEDPIDDPVENLTFM